MTIQPAHAHQDSMLQFSTDERQAFFSPFHRTAASPAPSEIVVTKLTGAGPGSLREALANAGAGAGAGTTIKFRFDPVRCFIWIQPVTFPRPAALGRTIVDFRTPTA